MDKPQTIDVLNRDDSHSEISPSSSHRWLNCPGSVQLIRESGVVDSQSEAAAEGTAAHALAELCLENGTWTANDFIGLPITVTNIDRNEQETVFSFEVDKNFADHVDDYIEYCRELIFTADWFKIEKSFDLTDYTSIDDKPTSGALDFCSISGTTLDLVDFKFGKGVPVTAENNSQLRLYGLGALDELSMYFNIEKVRVHIHQPRIGLITDETLTPNEFRDWALEKVGPALTEIISGDAPIVPDPDVQCKFCPVNSDCKALATLMASKLFDDVEEKGFTDLELKQKKNPKLLTIEEKVAIKRGATGLEGWVKKIKKDLMDMALAGEKVPGLKLVAGKTSRDWTDADKADKALARIKIPLDERKVPATLKSPTQIEKIIGKDHRIMSKYVVKSEGAPTLVDESDKREELKLDDVADNFKIIDTEET